MAKGAPEPQQSSQDGSLDFLWMMALLLGAIILTWYFGKAYISSVIFQIKYYEIIALNYFFAILTKPLLLFNLPIPNTASLNQWLVFIRKNYGAGVDFDVLADLCTATGNYLRYPIALILSGLAALLYFKSPLYRFRHVYSMDTLKVVEQKDWPQITPVMNLDLISIGLDEGPWAMTMSPMLFCKKNNLLEIEQKDGRYQATLHRGAAYRVLSLQLGPRWYGVEALPMHIKALFAIFAARINGEKTSADALIDQISESARSISRLNFSGVEELLRKNYNSKKVLKIIGRHGYVTTAMASLLSGAREAGVLASAEFIWLKPVDRRMWYMLSSVGRPTAFSEIAGAYAHWLAERKLGLPLVVPMVEEAVNGLENAIASQIYKPDED
ncbi:MAG: type IVB secretion system coupling complex protein DotM/IcmP [Gammaproteobacteria bacterium]|nr:type IVB secretion system coupling complex protein DotM/IcmP [Gammaproteobacteria bacterium]